MLPSLCVLFLFGSRHYPLSSHQNQEVLPNPHHQTHEHFLLPSTVVSQFLCDQASGSTRLWLFTAESQRILKLFSIFFFHNLFPCSYVVQLPSFLYILKSYSPPNSSPSCTSLLSVEANTSGMLLHLSSQRHLFWRITPSAWELSRPTVPLGPEICLPFHPRAFSPLVLT